MSILVRFILSDTNGHKESIMNRFLATTAVALMLGAAPALAQNSGVARRAGTRSLGAGSDAA